MSNDNQFAFYRSSCDVLNDHFGLKVFLHVHSLISSF